jgi:hypothetical protein
MANSTNDDYLKLLERVRANRIRTCDVCTQRFDPKARTPSALSYPTLCVDCENKELGNLVQHLSEDMPGNK